MWLISYVAAVVVFPITHENHHVIVYNMGKLGKIARKVILHLEKAGFLPDMLGSYTPMKMSWGNAETCMFVGDFKTIRKQSL